MTQRCPYALFVDWNMARMEARALEVDAANNARTMVLHWRGARQASYALPGCRAINDERYW